MVKNRSTGSRIFNVCNIAFFALVMIVCILPVWHVFCASFSNASWVMNQRGLIWHIEGFTFNGYQLVFNDNSIWTGYLNTFIYVIGTTVLGMFLTVMAAYALSRKDFIWANPLMLIISFTMLFNGGMVPWYIVCVKFLHLNNTIFALIVPYLMNAFYVMIMRTFYQTTIPDAIVESARIDGCGDFRIFRTIVLPLALPGLATIGLFNTLAFWNDYYLPLMLVTDQNLYNLQYMLYKLLVSLSILEQIPSTSFSMEAMKLPGETARMAMCILSIGPIIIAYPFFQKYFIKGLTIGSVKG